MEQVDDETSGIHSARASSLCRFGTGGTSVPDRCAEPVAWLKSELALKTDGNLRRLRRRLKVVHHHHRGSIPHNMSNRKLFCSFTHTYTLHWRPHSTTRECEQLDWIQNGLNCRTRGSTASEMVPACSSRTQGATDSEMDCRHRAALATLYADSHASGTYSTRLAFAPRDLTPSQVFSNIAALECRSTYRSTRARARVRLYIDLVANGTRRVTQIGTGRLLWRTMNDLTEE